VYDPGWGFRFMTVLTLTTGTTFVMWLGEQITERGIGNGMSLIIFAGIVVGLPSAVFITLEQLRTGQMTLFRLIALLVLMIVVVATIVFVERGSGGSRSSTPSAWSGAACTAGRARTSR
jgi:preprotein translocase subunit SecY